MRTRGRYYCIMYIPGIFLTVAGVGGGGRRRGGWGGGVVGGGVGGGGDASKTAGYRTPLWSIVSRNLVLYLLLLLSRSYRQYAPQAPIYIHRYTYTTLIQYIYTHRYTYTTHTHIYKTYTITRIYTYKTHTDIQLYIYNTHYIYIHIQICIYIIQHTQIYIHTLVYTYNTHIYHLIYVIGWVIWGDFSFS